MNYYDVVHDLKRLVGLQLQSIRPGSDVTILDVTDTSVVIESASHSVIRRSLAEIRKITDRLITGDPIHVETVLAGSGSSRNQPETLMANLPYIEWLKIKNKKHIIWVKQETHAAGTVKEMDPVSANIVKTKYIISQRSNKSSGFIVFSSDINATIEFYSACLGIAPIYEGTQSAVLEFQGLQIIIRHEQEDTSNTIVPALFVNSIDQAIQGLNPSLAPFIFELPREGEQIPRQVLIRSQHGGQMAFSELIGS